MERRVLGKGLDALIPKKISPTPSREFTYLSLEKIKPGAYQPRQEIEEKELEELSKSIREKGVIQPIVVREIKKDEYEIVAGGRRYSAAKLLGLKEIPTIVKELSDKDAFCFAIIENLQRKDLNPIEEATAFMRLIEEFGLTHEDIATLIGKDNTTVVNTLRLLKLPSPIREALRKGLISRSQARTILNLEAGEQEKLFHQILKEGLPVREIEKRARKVSKKKRSSDPFVCEIEERLQKYLGTKVRVFNRRNNRGRLVIEYYSLNDLERIVEKLK
jgi:ParB family chromosome partitioning protein